MKVTSLTLQFRVICVNKLLAKFFWLITDSGWWIDRVLREPIGSNHGWHGSGIPASGALAAVNATGTRYRPPATWKPWTVTTPESVMRLCNDSAEFRKASQPLGFVNSDPRFNTEALISRSLILTGTTKEPLKSIIGEGG